MVPLGFLSPRLKIFHQSLHWTLRHHWRKQHEDSLWTALPSGFKQSRKAPDTDSLLSTGTGGTLDDRQIDCLLLDRVLEQDYQEVLNSCRDSSNL
ncbi:hypothetical protein MRX96_050563 [Rhipicephalus microplus]